MPTILVLGPYRFFFYSSDGDEPRHVHVERDERTAKYWLDPVALQGSSGYSPREVNRIHALVVAHQEELIDAWEEFFGR